MTRRAAILGLGTRGSEWANVLQSAGWTLTGFDPDPGVPSPEFGNDFNRCQTISETVAHASWVVLCLPDRLELMRKVMQRAQSEAVDGTVFAVASVEFDIDAIQTCALKPATTIRVIDNGDGGYTVDLSSKCDGVTRTEAVSILTELAATRSQDSTDVACNYPFDDAESA